MVAYVKESLDKLCCMYVILIILSLLRKPEEAQTARNKILEELCKLNDIISKLPCDLSITRNSSLLVDLITLNVSAGQMLWI